MNRFETQMTTAITLFFVAPLVLGSDAPLWDGHESVEQYAQRVNLPPTKTLDLGNGVKLETVLIPAGKFIMGTPEPTAPGESVRVGLAILGMSGLLAFGLLIVVLWQAFAKRQRPKFSLRWLMLFTFVVSVGLYGGVRWHKTAKVWQEFEAEQARYAVADLREKPAHEVTLTQPFYMGKFVVTQEQYQQVTGINRSVFRGQLMGANHSALIGSSNPVDTVSWDDARVFCKKLTEQTEQTVRLPTEAEWEYSCRAGTRTTYYSGDTDKDLDRVAWYGANSKKTTHPVGQKEANGFGLFDMHGNVRQWCWDFYDEYPKEAVIDSKGPAVVALRMRMLRGGSSNDNPQDCRSAFRDFYTADYRYPDYGFRVVVVAPSSRTP